MKRGIIMKDNRLKGIIALAVVTVLAFGVVYGTSLLGKDGKADGKDEIVEGAIDVTGYDGISAAREITDDAGTITGYAVTTAARGFAGNITLEVTFETDATTISSLSVISHSETEGYGAVIATDDYLSQFPGKTAPVALGDAGNDSEIDAVSGATMTSNAVVKAINQAYDFISAYAAQ
jgi:electron transport complex protein RnfG